MREVQYRDFSWDIHQKLSRFPIVGELELTFACPIRCDYCYTDCYNTPEHIKQQMSFEEIQRILDIMRREGTIWLLFTGGDPLMRKDFFDIYDYAKSKGFLITLFASGLLFTEKALERLKKSPPFNIEVTIMGSNEEVYETISGVKGSWKHFLEGVHRVMDAGLPLKLKTVVCKQNYHDLENIKKLLESWGKEFRPSTTIFARLNGDKHPATLRIMPERVLEVREKYGRHDFEENPHLAKLREPFPEPYSEPGEHLFKCAAGYNTFRVDPNGRMIFCTTLREPSYDLRSSDDFHAGFKKMFAEIRSMTYQTDSKCRTCNMTHLCVKCPGKGLLENGNMEDPIDYFCELSTLTARELAEKKLARAGEKSGIVPSKTPSVLSSVS